MSLEHQNPDLDRILAVLVVGIPSAILSMLGAAAYFLTKDDPAIKTKQFIGGVILSGFTGGLACAFLLQSGIHPELAAVSASAIGSAGIKGYEWLLQRTKDVSDK